MKQNELLSKSISKLYRKYLIPTLIGVVSNSLYCLVDVYFISFGSGNSGLAALNIAMPLFTIYSAIGLLFGVGCATIMSIAEGNKNTKLRNQTFTQGIFFMLVIGFLLTILSNVFIENFAYALGSSKNLLPYVLDYMRPICISTTPFIIMYATSILLRSDHNPKLAMYALMCGNISNIILDYVFVVLFGWGILGASIATALSPIITTSIACFHFFKKKNTVKFDRHFLDFTITKRMIKNGLGSGLMEISAGSIIIIFNAVILSISTETYLAAFSIITNIAYVIKGILNGFAQAAQPIISINHGANNIERTKNAFLQSIKYSLIFSSVLCFFFIFFPKIICTPFVNGNKTLLNITAHGIQLYFTSIIFMALNIMIMYYLQAIEKGHYSTLLAVLKGFVFIVLSLLLLVPSLNIDGVWLSITLAEIATLCVFVIFNKLKMRNAS